MTMTAEKRPWITEADLDRSFWMDSFIERYTDLVYGHCEHELMKEWALELYEKKGNLSPWRVANDEFRGQADVAEFLPGGKYWKVLEEVF